MSSPAAPQISPDELATLSKLLTDAEAIRAKYAPAGGAIEKRLGKLESYGRVLEEVVKRVFSGDELLEAHKALTLLLDPPAAAPTPVTPVTPTGTLIPTPVASVPVVTPPSSVVSPVEVTVPPPVAAPAAAVWGP